MADTNAKEVLDGENKTEENKTPDKNQTAPAAQENKEPGAGVTHGEQPKAETPPKEQPQAEMPSQESKTAPPEKAAQDKPAAGEKDSPPARSSRPPKDVKAEKSDKPPEKPKQAEKPPKAQNGKQTANIGGGIGGTNGKAGQAADKANTPPPAPTPENVAPEPEPPRDANRINEKETIVYIDHADLHPFKNHPFQVRDDDAMKTLVESVKERGVDQPAIVRPRDGGGFELVAGHRRQAASEMAGIKNVPCVVRNLTDEEAILAMTESNFNQRSEILASERAQALKMQLDAIKRQGVRFKGVASGDVGKRSNEIVAEKNQMSVKNVQRYIALNKLVPDLMKMTDEKKIPFMTAFEMSYIKPKNQNYIAVAIEAQESAPSLSQAQRMRELDNKGILNGDVIDGIMLEEKKEEIKVIISGQELAKYFGAEKTPKEMKDTILKLLDEYKGKQPPELTKPDKKKELEK